MHYFHHPRRERLQTLTNQRQEKMFRLCVGTRPRESEADAAYVHLERLKETGGDGSLSPYHMVEDILLQFWTVTKKNQNLALRLFVL